MVLALEDTDFYILRKTRKKKKQVFKNMKRRKLAMGLGDGVLEITGILLIKNTPPFFIVYYGY